MWHMQFAISEWASEEEEKPGYDGEVMCHRGCGKEKRWHLLVKHGWSTSFSLE